MGAGSADSLEKEDRRAVVLKQPGIVHHGLRVAQERHPQLPILHRGEQARVDVRVWRIGRSRRDGALVENRGGNRHDQRARFERQPLAKEVQPDAQIAADNPALRPRLANFAVAVDQPPAQRRIVAAELHSGPDVLDDVLVPLAHARRDELGRRAHAVRAAVADAPGVLDDVFGVAPLAVPNGGQIAEALDACAREGGVLLCIGEQACVHRWNLLSAWIALRRESDFSLHCSTLDVGTGRCRREKRRVRRNPQ